MKKAEQSAVTRLTLLEAARELFTERGYAGTTTEDIVQQAGVTRGALYYQFRDKAGLFRAVLEELNLNIVTQVVRALQSSQGEQRDLWNQIVHIGINAYLDACLDPAVQRIALTEAYAVLGWEEHRELDKRTGLGLIRSAIQELLDAGLITPQPLGPLACLILSAITEASMYIVRADDIPTARKEMGASLERMLDGMRMEGGGDSSGYRW